jgi:hypothetical protein
VDKRYQVFISSTYADLKEERRAVIETVIQSDCIPAGMELFPAADEEQLTFIKRVIDDCDYYLLIIGGRYGSVDKSGVSFTEREYDYAVSKGLKVIALIHENPDDIPFGKSEGEPEQREKLERFKEKVKSAPRLVKFWKNAAELPGLVALSLQHAIKTYPALGWVRANRVASEELLSEINDLRKRNDQLETTLATMQPVAPINDLAGLDEQMVLSSTLTSGSGYKQSWQATATWRQIFADIAPYVAKYMNEHDVKRTLERALLSKSGLGGELHIEDQSFQTVGIQLQALGLVEITYSPPPENIVGASALFSGSPGLWSLTPAGERMMVELRAVRTKAEQ